MAADLMQICVQELNFGVKSVTTPCGLHSPGVGLQRSSTFPSAANRSPVPPAVPRNRTSKEIHTHPDLSKLAIAETFDELQRLPRDLPHIFGFDGQVGQTGHAFVARHDQPATQTCSPGWIGEYGVNFKQHQSCMNCILKEEKKK